MAKIIGAAREVQTTGMLDRVEFDVQYDGGTMETVWCYGEVLEDSNVIVIAEDPQWGITEDVWADNAGTWRRTVEALLIWAEREGRTLTELQLC